MDVTGRISGATWKCVSPSLVRSTLKVSIPNGPVTRLPLEAQEVDGSCVQSFAGQVPAAPTFTLAIEDTPQWDVGTLAAPSLLQTGPRVSSDNLGGLQLDVSEFDLVSSPQGDRTLAEFKLYASRDALERLAEEQGVSIDGLSEDAATVGATGVEMHRVRGQGITLTTSSIGQQVCLAATDDGEWRQGTQNGAACEPGW